MSDPFAIDDMPEPPRAPQPRQGGIAARAMAAAAPASTYLSGLNPEQRDAVETIDGPVLVLAGAGTGKTRVLTTRIAHIIATGRAFPSQILAVTFTNKAAREMKERIGLLVGAVAEGMPWLGTFHSIGTKMLRRHAELVDLRPDFTILDTDDQLRLMKQLLQAENIDEKRWPARVLASMIDGWKNRGLVPAKVPAGEAEAFAGGRGRKLYADYQARLKALNACDFGDLLLESIRLLQENPEVLAQFQERFRFILVDEYQDTNVAQYLWLRLLAQRGGGRPQTCLLRRRRRPVDLRLARRGGRQYPALRQGLSRREGHPAGAELPLHRPYPRDGLQADHPTTRAGSARRSSPTARTVDKVTVSGSWDSEEEARQIGDEIEALQPRAQPQRVAILVRASFQMREFEDRFITIGLPYRVIGGFRFYERARDPRRAGLSALVRQPADDLAFERIFNTPKRGLGDATLHELQHLRARGSEPAADAVRRGSNHRYRGTEAEGAPDAPRPDAMSISTAGAMLETSLPHGRTGRDDAGGERLYRPMWQKDRSAEAAGRLENLKELSAPWRNSRACSGFLEHVSLVMEAAEGESEDAKVTIMTLHAAKGLEFETVFLPGWEEGLFPHPRALDEQGRAGLEEERRLAYVGITRAKERAKVYFAQNRSIHGSWNAAIPSRFVDELPEEHVEVMSSQSAFAHGPRRLSRTVVRKPVRPDDAFRRLDLRHAGLAARAGPRLRQ